MTQRTIDAVAPRGTRFVVRKALSRDLLADATNGQVAVMSRPFVEVDDQNAFDETKFDRF